jgi:hypothetical protein
VAGRGLGGAGSTSPGSIGGAAARCRGALDAGATREEILESIGVAILMGGGPAAVYGSEALEALEEFEAAGSR